MNIVRAQHYQLDEIFAIFRNCKRAMDDRGIFQWTDAYPTREIVEQDIWDGELYCLLQDERCAGVVGLSDMQDAVYATVDWEYNEGKVLVVHRLAVDPAYQGQGVATRLMDFAEAFALQRRYTSIRLDAYSKNPVALQLYERRGYVKRGEVYFSGREFVFHCYEKLISHSL